MVRRFFKHLGQGSESAISLLYAVCGFSLLSIGDSIIKTMNGTFPAPAVSALRYVFGAFGLLVAVLIVRGRDGLIFPKPWLHIGRALSVSLATLCFFLAIYVMPLAEATAIQFTAPIFTALLSAIFLKERAPRAVWVAIIFAFAGVLLVLRPQITVLGLPALLPLGAALGMSSLMIFNRKAAGVAPILEMQLLIAMLAAPVLITTAIVGHYSGVPQYHIPVPDWSVVARCAIVAMTATFSHMLIYMATVRTNAAVVAPMTYIQLLVAVTIGWFAFGDVPDVSTIIGAALIITGGLYLWRSVGKK